MTFDRWVIVALVVAVLICGLIRVVVRLSRQTDQEALVHEYLARLKDYVESLGADGEAYGWLTLRSNKMQSQLGHDGIFGAFKPPYANYQITNYAIVLNMLPDLRRAFEDDVLSRHVAHQYATTIQEALIRHAGTLEDRRAVLMKQLKNPSVWLREGVRTVLVLPLSLLSWTGIVSRRAIDRITGSALFKIVSGFAALAGVLSAIIGIALGWEPFMQLVARWWDRLL